MKFQIDLAEVKDIIRRVYQFDMSVQIDIINSDIYESCPGATPITPSGVEILDDDKLFS